MFAWSAPECTAGDMLISPSLLMPLIVICQSGRRCDSIVTAMSPTETATFELFDVDLKDARYQWRATHL